LLCWHAFDEFQEARDALKTVSDSVRDIPVPKSGHWIAEENPAFLTQTLLEFFAGK
jgi:pimeloyl-ACP methyl ester carboxylesterase